ncbi:hypothetical protein EJ04DRAFT_553526 [Polyplosphaeria fusca]|uniref:Uncharacterized protein n=1 Tax=Polyplosphaeria fusca TaxID=682080 RepID=A0A9P4QUX2_9PLEO|nr:hypothetical protein EJ04DRAFT_553526 [Polyplosphaeria fusca]
MGARRTGKRLGARAGRERGRETAEGRMGQGARNWGATGGVIARPQPAPVSRRGGAGQRGAPSLRLSLCTCYRCRTEYTVPLYLDICISTIRLISSALPCIRRLQPVCLRADSCNGALARTPLPFPNTLRRAPVRLGQARPSHVPALFNVVAHNRGLPTLRRLKIDHDREPLPHLGQWRRSAYPSLPTVSAQRSAPYPHWARRSLATRGMPPDRLASSSSSVLYSPSRARMTTICGCSLASLKGPAWTVLKGGYFYSPTSLNRPASSAPHRGCEPAGPNHL